MKLKILEMKARKIMIKFIIKGSCVDDLFHILDANGYMVQVNNTIEHDVYEVTVIAKNKANKEDK